MKKCIKKKRIGGRVAGTCGRCIISQETVLKRKKGGGGGEGDRLMACLDGGRKEGEWRGVE